jgi:hypothetical protein
MHVRFSLARCLALSLVGLALFFADRASASERLSVFMVVDGDEALAHNLVEVTIAELSGAGDWELVGMRELEASLKERPAVQRAGGLPACLEVPACLTDIGAVAGTRRAVIGKVRRPARDFELDMALYDTQTSSVERSAERAIASDVSELIVAVQVEAAELFPREAKSAPPDATPTPPALRTSPTGAAFASNATFARAPPLGTNATDSGAPPPPEQTSWSDLVGFTAAGAAIVAFSAAVIAGSIATSPPSGETRKEQQDDLARRHDYATAANVAFVAGGAFSAVAVVAFVWE